MLARIVIVVLLITFTSSVAFSATPKSSHSSERSENGNSTAQDPRMEMQINDMRAMRERFNR